MAGNQTVSRDAVRSALQQAMAAANVPPGQPVMLTGHSQGGITAAALVSDSSFAEEFNVTHVVTGGSPVARFDIPAAVQILSIERDQDPVPRLEGDANPERSSWVTITRDVSSDPGVTTPTAAHGGDVYRDTGRLIDFSTDPSVQHFLDGANAFLIGDAPLCMTSPFGDVHESVDQRTVVPDGDDQSCLLLSGPRACSGRGGRPAAVGGDPTCRA